MLRSLIISVCLALAAAAIISGAPRAQFGRMVPPATSSVASWSQTLVSQINTPINTATRYMALGYSITSLSGVTFRSMTFPVGGIARSIRAWVGSAPVGTDTWKTTLMVNGVASDLHCTITNTSSQLCFGDNGGNGVAIAAGTYSALEVIPLGTPATASNVGYAVSVVFSPTVANDAILMAYGIGFSTSAQNAVHPFANDAVGTVANRRLNILPDGGTIDKLYAVSNAPGAGTSYAYEVYKNGAATGVGGSGANPCVIADTGTACNDSVDTVSVAANDDINFAGTPTNTPAAASTGFGARYITTTSGAFPYLSHGQGNTNSTTAVTYYALSGHSGNTTETGAQNIVDAQTFVKLAVRLPSAPGAGKRRIYRLRVNAANSALSACIIEESATTCSVTGSIAVNDNDKVTISDDPDGTSPAAVVPQFALLATRS